MFKLLRNKRLFVLMIGFILFIAVIGFSLSNRKDLSWPEKFVKDTVGYTQQWLYKPAGYIAGLFQDIRQLRSIYEENEQLRTMAAAYARDKIEYNFTKQKNEELEKALAFTERQKQMDDYQYLIAQVVAVSPDAYNRTLSINLGSKDGIEPDMAVVTVDGLVGIVSKVSAFTSTVMPITEIDDQAPNSKWIAATILGREADSFGIISDYDEETDRLLMTKIPEKDKMQVGDTVITSGSGNVFPKGIVIGTVESRQVSDFGLTNTAAVRISADFDHLSDVFVIKIPKPETGNQ